jgi:hypothetical protein
VSRLEMREQLGLMLRLLLGAPPRPAPSDADARPEAEPAEGGGEAPRQPPPADATTP